jgi:hypothetical protein
VSYGLRLADDAKQGLTALPFEVQDEVLDFLDSLTTEARIRSRRPRTSPDEVFDPVIVRGEGQYYIFVVVQFDHRSQTVEVKKLGHILHS